MMFGFRDEFEYFECAQCGCLQIKDIPKDLERYYPENYFAHKPLSSPLTIFDRIRTYFRTKRNSYIMNGKGVLGKILTIFIPNNRFNIIKLSRINLNSRIMDVGCGDGLLIRYLGDMGYKNSIGIDPMIDKDIKFENGINIYKKNLEEIDDLFDLIMFHHSFEHMSDPNNILQIVHKLMAPDGVCIIRIPTMFSSAWLQYGVNWVSIDAPRHVFIPSIESMKILCDNAGLTLDDIIYDSTILQFWGSEQYSKDIPLVSDNSYGKNHSNSIFSTNDIKNFQRKTNELNATQLGDSAAFFIKK